jgi:hypothetical protein
MAFGFLVIFFSSRDGLTAGADGNKIVLCSFRLKKSVFIPNF